MVQYIVASIKNAALLDLLISNTAEPITNVHLKENLNSSGHNIISLILSCEGEHTGKIKTPNFDRENFPISRTLLQDLEGILL